MPKSHPPQLSGLLNRSNRWILACLHHLLRATWTQQVLWWDRCYMISFLIRAVMITKLNHSGLARRLIRGGRFKLMETLSDHFTTASDCYNRLARVLTTRKWKGYTNTSAFHRRKQIWKTMNYQTMSTFLLWTLNSGVLFYCYCLEAPLQDNFLLSFWTCGFHTGMFFPSWSPPQRGLPGPFKLSNLSKVLFLSYPLLSFTLFLSWHLL